MYRKLMASLIVHTRAVNANLAIAALRSLKLISVSVSALTSPISQFSAGDPGRPRGIFVFRPKSALASAHRANRVR